MIINAVKAICIVAVTIPVVSHGSQSSLPHKTSIDPSGCVLEHVAVEEGIRQFQFDDVLPDGDRLAVGWKRSDGERGTYILELASGKRKNIPGFNNSAAFSPDGSTLVNSIYVDNGKTDIVEYSLQTEEITEVASHPDWDWLASYSSDGGTILFNSYRSGASDIYTYTKASGKLKQWTKHPGYEAHGQF